MDMNYYDRQGRAVGIEEYVKLREDDNFRVAKTTVGAAEVSTVWLGLNHNLPGEPLAIFETMVFGGELDQSQQRYATEAQAAEGHRLWCQRVQAADGAWTSLARDPKVAAAVRLVAGALHQRREEIGGYDHGEYASGDWQDLLAAVEAAS